MLSMKVLLLDFVTFPAIFFFFLDEDIFGRGEYDEGKLEMKLHSGKSSKWSGLDLVILYRNDMLYSYKNAYMKDILTFDKIYSKMDDTTE